LQEDLFQQPGLRPEFEQIRDCLDKGMHDTLRILRLMSGKAHYALVIKAEKDFISLLCPAMFFQLLSLISG